MSVKQYPGANKHTERGGFDGDVKTRVAKPRDHHTDDVSLHFARVDNAGGFIQQQGCVLRPPNPAHTRIPTPRDLRPMALQRCRLPDRRGIPGERVEGSVSLSRSVDDIVPSSTNHTIRKGSRTQAPNGRSQGRPKTPQRAVTGSTSDIEQMPSTRRQDGELGGEQRRALRSRQPGRRMVLFEPIVCRSAQRRRFSRGPSCGKARRLQALVGQPERHHCRYRGSPAISVRYFYSVFPAVT